MVSSKALFALQRRDARESDGVVTAFRDGEVTLRGNRRVEGFTNAIAEFGYQGIRNGDLVIHSMDGFAGAIGVSDSDGKASPVVHAYRPIGDVDPRYYAYVLRDLARSGFIASLAKGIRERSTAFDSWTFRSLMLPCPPADEQRTIADFLDAETARIDALIAKKHRMIDLLEEQHAAFLSTATRGPRVRLRRLLLFIEQGWSPDCYQRPAEPDEWGVLKAGCVNGGVFRADENKALPAGTPVRPRLEIKAGDILMSRASGSLDLIGSAAIVPSVRPRLLLCDKVFRLRFDRTQVEAGYVVPLLGARDARNQIRLGVSGGSGLANNLPAGVIKEIQIPLPKLADQRRVADRIESRRQNFEACRKSLVASIELLKEKRQSLVTAAVTGQIAVPA